ncbi:hypothetical protein [Agromyces silvae]|uniref:hypothetical protein n=1 Tax=Agromyces silvae TaxID=3388266 RepID=UPI00280A6F7D|nr:hypothetical protein [Agromyces protaetiae]
MITALVSTVLVGAALVGGATPAPSSAGEFRDAEADVLVFSKPVDLPHYWASASFERLSCPPEAPYLNESVRYFDRPTFPNGVELRAVGGGVDAATLTTYQVGGGKTRVTGLLATTATSWTLQPRKAQIVLHCTDIF